jgi:hypothetical protein
MEFNVSKITKIFGVKINLYVSDPTNLSNYKIQIRNSSDGEPDSNILVQRDLSADFRSSWHWCWQNFSSSIILHPQFNPYYIVFDGSPQIEDFAGWQYDDADGTDDGRIFSGNSNFWTERDASDDFTLIIDEHTISQYNTSEVNMAVTINSESQNVNNTGLGKGNVLFSSLNAEPVNSSTQVSVFTTTAVQYNVSYYAQFSRVSEVNATYEIKNDTSVDWELNFTREKVFSNYSISFDLPDSWSSISVFRNGTDITSQCSITDELYIPESVILSGNNSFNIRANSPNVLNTITTSKKVYERSQTLNAYLQSNGSFTADTIVNFSLINPLGTVADSEIRAINSLGNATYSYTFALGDELGGWNVSAFWSSATNVGYFVRSFNVTFIPRSLTINVRDREGDESLKAILNLYDDAYTLLKNDTTDANGYFKWQDLQENNYTLEVYLYDEPSNLIANVSINLEGDTTEYINGYYSIPHALSVRTVDQRYNEPLQSRITIYNSSHFIFYNGTTDANGYYDLDLPAENYTVECYYPSSSASLVANQTYNLLHDIYDTIVCDYNITKYYTLSLSVFDQMGEPLMADLDIYNFTGFVLFDSINAFESYNLPEENYTLEFRVDGILVNTTLINLNSYRSIKIYCDYIINKSLTIQTFDAEGDEPLDCRIKVKNESAFVLFDDNYSSTTEFNLPKGNYTFEFYYYESEAILFIGNVSIKLDVDTFKTYYLNYSIPHTLRIRTVDTRYHDMLICNISLYNSTDYLITQNESVDSSGYKEWELPADNFTLLCYYQSKLVANVTFNLLFDNFTTIVCDYNLTKNYSLTISVFDKMGEPLMVNISIYNSTSFVKNSTIDSFRSFNLPSEDYILYFYVGSRLVNTTSISLATYSSIEVVCNYVKNKTLTIQTTATGGEPLACQIVIMNGSIELVNGSYSSIASFTLPKCNYTLEFYYGALLVGNVSVELVADMFKSIVLNYSIRYNYTLSLSIYDRLGELVEVGVSIKNSSGDAVVNATVNGIANYYLVQDNYSVECWIDSGLVANVSVNLNTYNSTTIYCDYVLNKTLTLSLFDAEGDESLVCQVIIRNESSDMLYNYSYNKVVSFSLPKGNYSLEFYRSGSLIGNESVELLSSVSLSFNLDYSTPHTLSIRTIDARYGEALRTRVLVYNSTGLVDDALTNPNGQYQVIFPSDNYTIECYYPDIPDMVANLTIDLLFDNYTTIVCDYNITKYYTLSLTIYDFLGEPLRANVSAYNSTGFVLNTTIDSVKTLNLAEEEYDLYFYVNSELVNLTSIELDSYKSIVIYCSYVKNKTITIQLLDREGDDPLSCRIVIKNTTDFVMYDSTFPSVCEFNLPKGNYTFEFYYDLLLIGNVSIFLSTDSFKTYTLNYSVPHYYLLSLSVYDAMMEQVTANITIKNNTDIVSSDIVMGHMAYNIPETNYTIEVRVNNNLLNVTQLILNEPSSLSIILSFILNKTLTIQTLDRESDEPLSCRIVARNESSHILINDTFSSNAVLTLPKGNYTIQFYYNDLLIGNIAIELLTDTYASYNLNYSTPHLLRVRTLDRKHNDPLMCDLTLKNATHIITANESVSGSGYMSWELPADNYTLECWYAGELVKNVSFNLLFGNTTDIVCNYYLIYYFHLSLHITDSNGDDPVKANVSLWQNGSKICSNFTDNAGNIAYYLEEGNYSVYVYDLKSTNLIGSEDVEMDKNNDLMIYTDITIEHTYSLGITTLDREGNDILAPRMIVKNISGYILYNTTPDINGRASFYLKEGNYIIELYINSILIGNITRDISQLVGNIEETLLLNYSLFKTISIHTTDKNDIGVQTTIKVYNSTSYLVYSSETDANGYLDLDISDGNYSMQVFYLDKLKYNGTLIVDSDSTETIMLSDVDVSDAGIDPFVLWSVVALSVMGIGLTIVYTGVIRPRKARKRDELERVKKHYKEVFSIRNALVVHSDSGTCVSYYSHESEFTDDQLISGFITAIQSFGTEIKKSSEGLRSIAYHGLNLLLSRGGEKVDIVLVLEEEPSNDLAERLDRMTKAFETDHYLELVKFTGKIDPFQDFERYLRDYIEVDLNYIHTYDRKKLGQSQFDLVKSFKKLIKLGTHEFVLKNMVTQILKEGNSTDPKVYSEIDKLREQRALYPIVKEKKGKKTGTE